MKKIIVILWISIFAIVISFSNEPLASSEIIPESCTVFTASVGDTVLFGNNEDVGDKNALISFFPATEKTYGWVYFEFENYPILYGHFPMGGMNDQGLCFDITSIPESVMRPYPEKLHAPNPGVFGEKILRTCKTVEETVQFIEQYDLSSFNEFQFLFADRRGSSIVLCPGSDGEMKVVRKEGIYQVITNFNILQRQLGAYPCWRYSNASDMLAKIEREDDLIVEYIVDILDTAHQEGTTYSTIYDPVHGVVNFYNKHNFDEVAVFNLKDHFEKGYHWYSASSLFSGNGGSFEKPEEPGVAGQIYVILAAIFVVIILVAAMYKNSGKRERKK